MAEQKLDKKWVWPFELTREIGSGAMGKVYQAKYIKNGMILAVKFLPPEVGENPTYLARFQREMEILRNMKHPHIVRCFGGTTQGKDQFYAMELVDGGSIYSVIKEMGKIPWRKTVEYGLQMCNALEYTHAQGVIHRDIKPGNFLLTKADQVKLADFGLALLTAGQHLTADGKTVGTLLYMAPEQISGNPPESPQTDLYSLGCVFYEMLTGKPVFNALAAGKIVHSHLQDPPPHVKDSMPEVPLELDTLIDDLLKKRDLDRPASAAEVAERLRKIVEGGSWGRVDTPAIGSQLLATAATVQLPTSRQKALRDEEELPLRILAEIKKFVPIAILIFLQLLIVWRLGAKLVPKSEVTHWKTVLKSGMTELQLTAIKALEEMREDGWAATGELQYISQADRNPKVREAAKHAREVILGNVWTIENIVTWVLVAASTIAAIIIGRKWWKSFNED